MSLALVLGGAACVWDDAVAVLQLANPDLVIAVNDMIPRWPRPLDHAATLHPDNLPRWIEARRHNGFPDVGQIWSYRPAPLVQRLALDWRGSSALFAVNVMLNKAGATGVIVAGCPLDRSPHLSNKTNWLDAHAFYPGWFARRKKLMPCVRSMGGWTCKLLGAPTVQWLADMQAQPPDAELIAAIESAAHHGAATPVA